MICVSIQEKSPDKRREILSHCRMAEIRADLCRMTVPELEKTIASHPCLIATCRIAGSSIEFAREQLSAAIRKGARYVDVEIEAPADFTEYIRMSAKENGCKLIISYHDFEGTPSLSELLQIAETCRRKGADLIKIVTTARDIADAVRVLSLYDAYAPATPSGERIPLVAFAMGAAGKFTRYLCLHCGAPYTYVCCDSSGATAPGQYTLQEMERLTDPASYPCRLPQLRDTLFREIAGSRPVSVSIPCSKSIAQRAVLAAALAGGTSRLENYEPCNDIEGAIRVIERLGATVRRKEGTLEIQSPGAFRLLETDLSAGPGAVSGSRPKTIRIETGESGLLTRLMIPLASFFSGIRGNRPVEVTGHGSLLARNLSETAEALRSAGISCRTSAPAESRTSDAPEQGYLPFRIEGAAAAGKITFSGKESSQVVSGFLMMLPLLPHDTELTVTRPASLPYIELTLRTLDRFGIRYGRRTVSAGGKNTGDERPAAGGAEPRQETPEAVIYTIPGRQSYTPASLYLDSDWSSAAYFAVAGTIAAAAAAGEHTGITLRNMPLNSCQADERILDVLQACGAEIRRKRSPERTETGSGPHLYDLSFSASGTLRAFDFDATHCPDLFPILAVLACRCCGTSRIRGVSRLLQKESNRAEAIFTELTLLGARISIENDLMTVTGTALRGGRCRSRNDHRMAMSLSVAALFIGEAVFLDDLRCTDKSFPSFFPLLTGGKKAAGQYGQIQ